MELSALIRWLDSTLGASSFDDVSNNGLQLDRRDGEVTLAAFAVDASVASVGAAAAAGADILVVHHGISWGGGIRRIVGGVYDAVRTAVENDIAVAAYHLPLDAHETYGNNFLLARELGLENLTRAFAWRSREIGVVGELPRERALSFVDSLDRVGGAGAVATADAEKILSRIRGGEATALRVGVCSGGGGEYAVESFERGCDIFVTGEASWGERIAAENAHAPLVCLGHYETETFGVRSLARAVGETFGIDTVFIERDSK